MASIDIATFLKMESSHVDFKEKLETKKARSWLKTVAAFANTCNGYLIFGIRDEDQALVGIENCQEVAEKITELINARIHPFPMYEVTCIEKEKKDFIVVQVSKGRNTPYYYVSEGTKIAFVRKGNQSIEAPAHELNSLILYGNNQTFDELPAIFPLENASFTLLGATYVQRNPEEVFEEDRDLISFGLKTLDGQLTNAGALLCDQGLLRQSRISCTHWRGKEKGSLDLDAIDDKEYTGSLISLLENAVGFVQNNSQKRWVVHGLERKEEEDYPIKALREVIVNALIHRDYQIKGSEVHIDMYEDRLTVYSPGGMYNGWNIQDVKDLLKIQSVRRNPVIADVFSRLHFMDRKGSGIQRILNAYGILKSKVEFYSEADSFIVTLPNVSYARKQQMEQIEQKYSKKTKEQVGIVLNHMEFNKKYTTAELSAMVSLSESRVRQLLNILMEFDRVEKFGSNRYRCYSRIQ